LHERPRDVALRSPGFLARLLSFWPALASEIDVPGMGRLA